MSNCFSCESQNGLRKQSHATDRTSQFASDVRRFREIISILAKHGFAGFLETYKPEFILPALSRNQEISGAYCS